MIEVQGLTRKYGGAVAVDTLTFSVRPGQVTALIGPNGAGKSTALRMMLQLERGRGRTLFDGLRYRDLRHPAHEVGAWLGARPAYRHRRARSELAMLAAAHGIKRARVDEVLDLVGLTPVAGVRVGALSAGALGRLGIASALLGDPHTLVLDEPSAGQDPEGVRWLREFLRAYATQGRTVLVAGHGLSELSDCADRVLGLARGRLVVDETAAEFRTRAENPEVYVRTPQVQRLTELLRAEGLAVHGRGGAALGVVGADRARVGEIAFRGGVLVHELAQREVTVADAFCTVTAEARVMAAERAAALRAEAEAEAAHQARIRAARKSGRRGRRSMAGAPADGVDAGYADYADDADCADHSGHFAHARDPRRNAAITELDTARIDTAALADEPVGTFRASGEAALFRPVRGTADADPEPTIPAPHAAEAAPAPSAPDAASAAAQRAAHRRPKRRRWLSRTPSTPHSTSATNTQDTPDRPASGSEPAARPISDEVNA